MKATNVLLLLSLPYIVHAQAPIALTQVPRLAAESCLIVTSEPLGAHLSHILAAMEQLLSPVTVPAVSVPGSELSASRNIHLRLDGAALDPLGRQLLVLDRKPPDRSCLLTSGLSHVELRGEAFAGGSAAELLALLNRRCAAFWGANGTLTSQGETRRRILDGLFSEAGLPSPPVTMGALARRCADAEGGLAAFFYSGQCREEAVCRAEEECQEAPPRLPECERLEGEPSWEGFFADYLSRSRPVILSKAARDWVALRRWSPEFLRASFGRQRVHVKLSPPKGEFEGVEAAALWDARGSAEMPPEVREHLVAADLVTVRPHGAEVNFSTFLDAIEAPGPRNFSAYLEYSSIRDYLKGLESDIKEFPWIKDHLELRHTQMWLSDGNTLGKLHFDQYDNLLVQLRGRKQVILFDPAENARLGEGHIREALLHYDDGRFHRHKLLDSTSLTMSPFDLTRPDFERWKGSRTARPLNCTLSEGDVLYLPSFWWHEVQSYPDPEERRNLAINFWYDPFLTKEFPCSECKLDVNPLYRHLL